MNITIAADRPACGRLAAAQGAKLIRQALDERGSASIILATGASQFDTLEALLLEPGIAWENVTAFHLDEYVGIPVSHHASFRRYLWERFHRRLPVSLKHFYYIDGMGDPEAECKRLEEPIKRHPIDVCFAGIGENGHLAFNDPPADFDTERAYLVVDLDENCRRQQFGEGWFPSLEAVPTRAISMSIRQILKSKAIIITAPDERKAVAIRNSLEGPITRDVPASILQRHPAIDVFLDPPGASRLERKAA
ncbi:MAG TPA: glucosamine-6-phosphate deaminase [Chthoniobacteraceae bacterium]|nr:glucosamine-6-phosphate deaminase [Chthoniobacteraceae bacterium]